MRLGTGGIEQLIRAPEFQLEARSVFAQMKNMLDY
jgi:hypothetical protein